MSGALASTTWPLLTGLAAAANGLQLTDAEIESCFEFCRTYCGCRSDTLA